MTPIIPVSLYLFAIGALLVLILLPRIRYHRQYRKWRKGLQLDIHQKNFTHLFQAIDGFALSKKDREGQDMPELVYGEICFEPFIALLSNCQPDHETVFYDLGCGTGKALLAMAMVFQTKKAIGIEKMPGLCRCTEAQITALSNLKDYRTNKTVLELRQEDFCRASFKEATIVFINASALFGETWEVLCKKLQHLAYPCICITTSRRLPEKDFQLLSQHRVEMSWGVVTAYIQQRYKTGHR